MYFLCLYKCDVLSECRLSLTSLNRDERPHRTSLHVCAPRYVLSACVWCACIVTVQYESTGKPMTSKERAELEKAEHEDAYGAL
jgi:hypothetical protein